MKNEVFGLLIWVWSYILIWMGRKSNISFENVVRFMRFIGVNVELLVGYMGFLNRIKR